MSRFGIKEVADVILFDVATGKPALFFDTLKISNLENAAQTVFAEGGKGVGRLIGWDFGKTSIFRMQDALLSESSLGMLAGDAVKTGVQNITKREVVKVVTGEVTLLNIPLVGSIVAYASADGKSHDAELTVGTITAKDVAVSGGTPAVADGDTVIVYYEYASAATAKTVTISSDKFPGYYKVVADTVVRNESGVDESFQIVMEKAKLQPGFTLTLDAANVSVFDFNLDVFKADGSTEMVRMIKY